MMRCIDDRLTPFYLQSLEFNAHIRHFAGGDAETTAPLDSTATTTRRGRRTDNFIPYVGNGLFGLEIQRDAPLMIKSGRRNLALPVLFHPLVSVSSRVAGQRDATVTDYLSGVVHRFQCFDSGYFVSYEYYAHRKHPNLFVQELKITNTKNQLADIDLTTARMNWPAATTQTVK